MTTGNPEICKNEPEGQLNEYQNNIKKFEGEDKKSNGSILQGFGKMLGNFIDGKKIENPTQKGKAEDEKRNTIAEASKILHSTDLNAEGKQNALKKLFGVFQENKDTFPQNQEQLQQGSSTQQEKTEKFLNDLMQTIDENRVASQKSNSILAERIRGDDIPPVQSGNTKKPTLECMRSLNEAGLL